MPEEIKTLILHRLEQVRNGGNDLRALYHQEHIAHEGLLINIVNQVASGWNMTDRSIAP